MLAIHIIKRLMQVRHRNGWCLPNYTPHGWFECDVFNIGRSGYMQEFEVKTSLADFRADEKKELRGRNKHEMLAEGYSGGPSQFYFVVPAGLPIPVPTWAGLIEMSSMSGGTRLSERMVKLAPKIHNLKPSPKVIEHAESVCYWRMHSLYRMIGMPKIQDQEPS